MSKIVLESLPGIREFYPEDTRIKNWLFSKFKDTARIYGFDEYEAPLVEPVSLYTIKSGNEIVNQMYNFKDKSNNEITLRPEITPSLARMVLAQGKKLIMPIKWYTIGQCWRYETYTTLRKREHFQWNMDIWGVDSVTAEVELMAAIVFFLKSVGLNESHVVIRLSNRKLLENILVNIGIESDKFAKVCNLIDKFEKIMPDERIKELQNIELEQEVIDKILFLIDNNNFDTIKKYCTDSKLIEEFETLLKLTKDYGYDKWVKFDFLIVRGLAYYTGTVFEIFAKVGNINRALCGGGRYDKILSTYGSKNDISACGFGFGDVVILEILNELNLIPEELYNNRVDDIIIPFNEDLRGAACQVAEKLRSQGRRVDIILKNKQKIKTAYSYANRIGAERAIYIAPTEWCNGEVRVKMLRLNENDPNKENNVNYNNL
jgi:histidyl-tRNA synthetase